MQIKRKIAAAALVVLGVACSSGGSNSGKITADLKTGSDSLAYVVGVNIAEQLQKMDSTINYGVVCRAIMERSQGKSLMSDEEAKIQYLRYLLYVEPEQRRRYEEQFLSDLALNDREYTRTKSGITYHIEVIGDEKLQPKSANDWVVMNFKISRVGGEQVYPAIDSEEEYVTIDGGVEDFVDGVTQSLKMIGKGGKIRAWIPSRLGYGEEGYEEYGVEPTETLFYEIELVDVAKGEAVKRRQARELEEFYEE